MKTTKYIEVKFTCSEAFKEILIAELYDLGFDSMIETETGLEAYVVIEDFDRTILESLTQKYSDSNIAFVTSEFENKNWNTEWEKNYDPIIVEDKCLVRATFHENLGDYEYEIIITPKMSFGTGHHATTYLMIKHQMALNHQNMRVLDAGCGTAILAIMAEKLGAREVLAYDIDEWSIENAPENVDLNAGKKITVQGGTIRTINIEGTFDIVLANINKNVLLDELDEYSKYVVDKGYVVLSGFYTEDNDDIIAKANEVGLHLENKSDKDNWSSLILIKK